MVKIIQDMIPTKSKPPLREAIPVERERPRASHAIKQSEKIHIQKTEHQENFHLEELDKIPPLPPLSRQSRQPRPSRQTSRGVRGNRTVKPWLFAVIAFICLAAIIYGFSIVYAKATVTIIPTSIVIPVNGTYTAYENTAASGTLIYKIIQTNGEMNQTVAASIGPIVSTSAKGTVILYNNYGAASQRIIAGTRLSSGNGLIYTTDNAVVIPGISKGIAGSIPVAVTAAATGPSYNILPSDLTTNPSYGDFNVVAYKGTGKYSGFYARLNPAGAGITGGSAGHQIITSSTTVAAAQTAMKQSLQTNLLAQAQTLVPAGYILFSGADTLNYTPSDASTTSSSTASVGMQATFYGIIFKATDLAEAISPSQYNSSFNPQDLDSAQFTITNPQTFTFTNGSPLTFSLKGTMDLVGTLSTSTLAAQLAGVSLSDSAPIFKNYSSIATAHATILPFWKRSFPSSPSRINIVIQNQP